jgi:hypothetical protein
MARLVLHLVRIAPEALQRTARFAIEVKENPGQRRRARGFLDGRNGWCAGSERVLNYRGEAPLVSRSLSDDRTELCSPAETLHLSVCLLSG